MKIWKSGFCGPDYTGAAAMAMPTQPIPTDIEFEDIAQLSDIAIPYSSLA